MKVSIVTISLNQAPFLERTLKSVIKQSYRDLEYIVVDAGSVDGSREIIEQYRPMIDRVIFEPDQGPADGLNKGFKRATGEILGFINSDDTLCDRTVEKMVSCFKKNRTIDVISGDSILIDQDDTPIRKLHSDNFSLTRFAYGASFISQQSTFFKHSIFKKVGGFNSANDCAWDGELYVDMALAGGRFALIRDYWSCFRSHPNSITASAKLEDQYRQYRQRIFRKIMKRDYREKDRFIKLWFKVLKNLSNPSNAIERIIKGPVYARHRIKTSL
jgi:glycosyltransferase involved in cell wall biosynthesis